jgi:hypothetical protein
LGEPTVTVDAYLASLGADNVHSRGAFSISETAAREKLARYTLVHPSLYVLELLSAAVLGGASFLEVTTPGGDTHFRFDGQPLESSAVVEALGHLFVSSDDPRLSCLGLALSTAASGSGGELVLRLADGVFSFAGGALQQLSAEASSCCQLEVPGRFGFLGRLLHREASLRELLSRGSCAPLRLTLDGEELSQGWRPEQSWETAALLRWEHPDYPLDWGMSGISPALTAPSPGDFAALIAFMPLEIAAQNKITVIHQGVAYRVHDSSFHVPGVCAAVASRGLKRNLSRSEIVKDEALRHLLWRVESGAQLLASKAVAGPYRFCRNFRKARATVSWAFYSRVGREHERFQLWLQTEEVAASQPDPAALVTLAQEKKDAGEGEVARALRLLALDLVVDRLQAWQYRRYMAENFPHWAELLERLVDDLSGTERESSMRAFLAFVQPLSQPPQSLPAAGRILTERLLGHPETAASLLDGWVDRKYEFEFRVPVEVLLAVRRTEEALSRLLSISGCDSVAAALGSEWPRHKVLELDFLADILELLGDSRALRAREMAYHGSEGGGIRAYRCLELCRHARACGSMLEWVRYRATASLLSVGSGEGSVAELEARVPALCQTLQGRSASMAELDEMLLPLCDAYTAFSEEFPYLLHRVAHRMRMAGEPVKADQLLARGYTLRAMEQTLSPP